MGLEIRRPTAAVVLLSLAALAACEKKIELQDIEDDNLKSEMEKVITSNSEDGDVGRYLKPPPNLALIYGDHQPHQPDFTKTQYEVQDTPADDYPTPDYLSSLYAFQNQPDITQREVAPGNYLGNGAALNYLPFRSMFGYAPPVAMHLVYIPQYTAASNQVPIYSDEQATQPKVEIQSYSQPQLDNVVYQQQQQQLTQGFAQQYADYNQQDQPMQQYAPQIAYISVPTQLQQPNQQENLVIAADYPNQYTSDVNQVSKIVNKFEPTIKPTINYPKPIFASPIKYKKPTYQFVTPAPTVQSLQSPRPTAQIPQPSPTPSSLVYESHHLPKVLSHHGHPLTRPVYSHISGNLVQPSPHQSHPHQNLIYLPKRRPTSLLDSYIPSSIQLEYLKRGLSKDPLSTYDTIAYSNRIHPSLKAFYPRVKSFERGFLPNQMVHTAAGSIGFANFKRGIKSGKNIA